ncbi:MAG: hypothetical protein KGM99_12275 [Burkholderiales bacterium]|nr:hypothetical protein [Burkholderiales bacterium]
MSYLAILELVIKLSPSIFKLVKQAQEIFTEPNSGEQKSAYVQSGIAKGFKAVGIADDFIKQIEPVVQGVIEDHVTTVKSLAAAADAVDLHMTYAG